MQISAASHYSEALDALLKGACFSTRVRGNCMVPVVPDGACVTVNPAAKLRCGDVMLWRDNLGQLVCHRYLGRFPGRRGIGAVSWADNASRPDGLVPAERVIGGVTMVDGHALHAGVRRRLVCRIRYWRFCALAFMRQFT